MNFSPVEVYFLIGLVEFVEMMGSPSIALSSHPIMKGRPVLIVVAAFLTALLWPAIFTWYFVDAVKIWGVGRE